MRMLYTPKRPGQCTPQISQLVELTFIMIVHVVGSMWNIFVRRTFFHYKVGFDIKKFWNPIASFFALFVMIPCNYKYILYPYCGIIRLLLFCTIRIFYVVSLKCQYFFLRNFNGNSKGDQHRALSQGNLKVSF